jgi:hypothetical protein
MKFRPQDIVALVLALMVFIMLISTTNFNLLWSGADEVVKVRDNIPPVLPQFWRDVMNIVLGALAGYIAGRTSEQ